MVKYQEYRSQNTETQGENTVWKNIKYISYEKSKITSTQ